MNPKILLVDDEERFISTLAKRLTLRGMTVEWVCRGEDAISKVKENKYDLAMLDVKMPGIGGIELKRVLHQLDPDLKFIFITGHGSGEDFAIGSTEASSYLVKPLTIENVMGKIHEALDE
jgi:DNA-binding NtrC family response regulator